MGKQTGTEFCSSMKDAPKVMASIYFQGNYKRYRVHKNAYG
jgi:hypothetical protein